MLGDMLSLLFELLGQYGGFAKTLVQGPMEFADLLLLLIELGVKAQLLFAARRAGRHRAAHAGWPGRGRECRNGSEAAGALR